MEKLSCKVCGYASPTYPVGLNYMDIFYKNTCKKCLKDIMVCLSCSGNKIDKPHTCESCERDKKIEKLLDE